MGSHTTNVSGESIKLHHPGSFDIVSLHCVLMRFQSNPLKTKENIFCFFLPWLRKEPRTFVLCSLLSHLSHHTSSPKGEFQIQPKLN